MEGLHLALLGGFRARRGEQAVLAYFSRRYQALLGYLAMPAGRPHSRDKLAALLWGDMAQAQARANLRQAIHTLRKGLEPLPALRLEGETVALASDHVTVDVACFERALEQGTADALTRAATLYQGDLLAGLVVQEAPFEEWLFTERERLRELAGDALTRLLVMQRQAGHLEAALQTGLRMVALDPLQEPVHRTLMRLYAETGRRAQALRQYQVCVATLERELRAEPEEETRALYRDILRTRRTRLPPDSGDPVTASEPDVAPDVRRLPPPPRMPASETELIGRDAELSHLRDALAAACAGRGRLVAIVGDAGVGKSRLVDELLGMAERAGARSLVGRAFESEQILPFAPWVDAFRSGGVADDRMLMTSIEPVWRAELAHLLPEIETQEAARGAELLHRFEAVARLLERLAMRTPLVVVLEDVHWADDMSLRLLVFLARRVLAWPVMLLVTARLENLDTTTALRHARDDLARDGQIRELRPGPLSRRDTGRLSARLVHAAAGRETLAAIEEPVWRLSEGNPFVIVETMRALRDPARGAEVQLPARVRHLVGRRLERLGDRSRHLVATAAVIGRRFDLALLQHAAGLADLEIADGVEELVRERVLHHDAEELEFVHDRIREVAREQLLPVRRVLLHRRVAEAVESLHAGDLGPHAAVLGRHYRDGEVWGKAAHYLALAGTRAAAQLGHREAAACYEDAMAAMGRLPESADVPLTADVRFHAGYSLYSLGEFEKAATAYRDAEAAAVALKDDRRLALVLIGLAYLLGSRGEPGAAVTTGNRALALAESLGDAALGVWSRINLMRHQFAQGDHRSVIAHARCVSDTLATDLGDDGFGRGSILSSVQWRTWLALSLGSMGEFVQAIAHAEQAIRVAEAEDRAQDRLWAYYTLGRVHLERGDFASAVASIERAHARCSNGEFPIYLPRVLGSLASARAHAGDVERALPLLVRAMSEAEDRHVLVGHSTLLVQTGEVHLLAGHPADAEPWASRALTRASQHGERGVHACAQHLLAAVAARREPERTDAAAGFDAALRLASDLGLRPLAARCELDLGALYQRTGQTERAREHLGRAITLFRQMQMSTWLTRAEQLLATT